MNSNYKIKKKKEKIIFQRKKVLFYEFFDGNKSHTSQCVLAVVFFVKTPIEYGMSGEI